MAREKRRKNKADTKQTDRIEKTVDPYTGELKPVPADADKFIEVVPQETEDRSGSNYLLNEETSMDHYAADSDADAVAEQSAHYTEDQDIEEDFAERQDLAASGREELEEELNEHHSLSPDLSAGDVDASWQTANTSGEETLGGTVPTPDQDIVDNLGKAAGLTYNDDEPLNSDKKVLDRDRHRWELNPASVDKEYEGNDEESLQGVYDEVEDEYEDEEEEESEDLEDDEEVDEDLEGDLEEEDEEDLDELGDEIEEEDE
jgi:hypothetical protein